MYLALWEFLPPFVAASIAIGVGAWFTGGFHEDGLGDTFDAFGGGKDAEDVRRILKDPRQGTFGVLAIATSLLIRVGALASMDGWDGLAICICAHVLARGASVALMGIMRTASDGLGASYATSLTPNDVGIAVATGALIAFGIAGPWAMPAAVLAGIAAWLVGRRGRARLGGITGDILGAAEQMGEMLIFTLGAAVSYNAWVAVAWWH